MNKQRKKDPVHLIGVSGRIGSGKDLVGTIIKYIYYCRKNNIEINYSTFEAFNLEVQHENSMFWLYREYDWSIRKFADNLKRCTCVLLGCSREMLEDREYKETELDEEWWYYKAKDGKSPAGLFTLEEYNNLTENQQQWLELVKLTPRLILQLLGTECGREILHPNVWVNALMAEYDQAKVDYYGDELIGNASNWRGRGKIMTKYNERSERPNWIITDLRFPNEANAIKARNGIVIKINRPNNNIEATGIQQHASETALDNYEFDYVVENDGTIEDLIFKIDKII